MPEYAQHEQGVLSAGAVAAQLSRDIRVSLRAGGGWLYAVFFFAAYLLFTVFALGPDQSVLRSNAPALIWLGLALALQLSCVDLFISDMRDDTLRISIAEQGGLASYMTAKALVVLSLSAGPIVVITPLALVLLGVAPNKALDAWLALVLGAPAAGLCAVFSAALGAGLRSGGLLATILSAPILIPVLIFGVASMQQSLAGQGLAAPELRILAALTLVYGVALPPFAISALRVSLE